MVMERLGKGSKMMLCGDVNQIDLAKNITSGIKFLDYLQQKELKNFSKIVLKTNHRDPIVEEILNLYEDFKNKNN
jgi:phosphate starvation-inducible protein PhoH